MTTGILVYVLLQREEVNSISTMSQLFISYSGGFVLKWCSGWHSRVKLVTNTELVPRVNICLFSPLHTYKFTLLTTCKPFFWPWREHTIPRFNLIATLWVLHVTGYLASHFSSHVLPDIPFKLWWRVLKMFRHPGLLFAIPAELMH